MSDVLGTTALEELLFFFFCLWYWLAMYRSQIFTRYRLPDIWAVFLTDLVPDTRYLTH